MQKHFSFCVLDPIKTVFISKPAEKQPFYNLNFCYMATYIDINGNTKKIKVNLKKIINNTIKHSI